MGRRGTGGEVLLQVPRALGVVDGAVGAHDVGIGGAVLGDVQLAGALVVGEAQQQALDTGGVDLPVHAGAGNAQAAHRAHARRGS